MDNEIQVKSKEDLLIDKLEQQVEENKRIRADVINILKDAVTKSDIANTSDAKLLQSKTEMFSTLNSFLDSNTKDTMAIAKIVMAQRVSDVNEEVAKYTVATLKSIRGIEAIPQPLMTEKDLDDVDELLDKIETPPISEAEKDI